jgi:ubiquinone/menaquinone biosynthesis C-methylase UbiE
MEPPFSNVYDDPARSQAYAKLEFPGTYYLAYRDLPAIIREHVRGGRKAIDFGFDAIGLDVASPMLDRARERDPKGEYRLVTGDSLSGLASEAYDLVLSAFTFDNIPTREQKIALLRSLGRLLRREGRIVNLVSSPEIYLHEWASFSTKDFPANRRARCGDKVQIVMLDVEDRRPVEDVLWTDEGYREVFEQAALTPIQTYRPLAKPSEPYAWVSETTVAPWAIYVLGRARTD